MIALPTRRPIAPVIGLAAAMLLPLTPLLAGCGGNPSAANITLRKQLQDRDDQIASLQRQHTADQADLRTVHEHPLATAAIPPDSFAKLFTVHGIAFGRLTGGADLDPAKPGDEGLKVYVVPKDDDDQPIKAAGSFHIEAFDLVDGGKSVGKWDFDTDTARKNWYGAAMLYTYVLTCPWEQVVPSHSELTLRVTFHDELTGREFSEQRVIKVNLPPASQPTGT